MNEGNLEENIRHDIINLDIWICLQRWSFRFQSSVQNQSETGYQAQRGGGGGGSIKLWVNYVVIELFFLEVLFDNMLRMSFFGRGGSLLVSPFTRRSLNRTHGRGNFPLLMDILRFQFLTIHSMSSRPTLTWHEWDFCKWYSFSRSFLLRRQKFHW